MAKEQPFPRGEDRRKRSTPAISRYVFWGGRRRTGGRREGESVRAYVDIYGMRLWVALSLIAILNLLDAHFTLLYLQRGGHEANAIVVWFLARGMTVFLAAKLVVFGLAVPLLCLHKNFPFGRLATWLVLGFYALLFGYHLLLYAYTFPS